MCPLVLGSPSVTERLRPSVLSANNRLPCVFCTFKKQKTMTPAPARIQKPCVSHRKRNRVDQVLPTPQEPPEAWVVATTFSCSQPTRRQRDTWRGRDPAIPCESDRGAASNVRQKRDRTTERAFHLTVVTEARHIQRNIDNGPVVQGVRSSCK